MDKIIITKKVAKQGKNNVIVIPSFLKQHIKAGSLVKVEITNLNDYPVNNEEK